MNNDEEIENDFVYDLLSHRKNFNSFVINVIDNRIEEEIYNFIRYINVNNNDKCATLFGGRSWHNLCSHYTNSLPNVSENYTEIISCIKGNFDILIVTNDYPTIQQKKQTKKSKELNEMQSLIINFRNYICSELNNKLKILNLDHEYIFKIQNYLQYGKRTINLYAQSFLINLVVLKKENTFNLKSDEPHIILYIEYGTKCIIKDPNNKNRNMLINNPINALNFKKYLINQTNLYEVNECGLLLLSNFINTSRNASKGINLDDIRANLFKKIYMNEKVLNSSNYLSSLFFTEQAHTPENLCVNILYVIFQRIFEIKNYSNTFSNILQKLMSSYDAKVIDNFGNEITYSTFWDTFNSEYILNMLHGGSKNDESANFNETIFTPNFFNQSCNFPSLRQLINIILIQLDKYEKDISVEVAGGDAIRRIIPNEQLITSDIDSKIHTYGYIRKSDVNKKHKYDIRITMFLISIYLTTFLNYFGYFRFNFSYKIKFGDTYFTLKLNTYSQELISTSRILLNFFVPLVSIDCNLKYLITKDDDGKYAYGTYKLAPLDLASINAKTKKYVNKIASTKLTFFKFENTNDMLNFVNKYSSNYDDNEYMTQIKYCNDNNDSNEYFVTSLTKTTEEGEVKMYIAPINMSYLHEDLQNNVFIEKNKKTRIITGKHNKDIKRYEAINNKINEVCNVNEQLHKLSHNNYYDCAKNILLNNIRKNKILSILDQITISNNRTYKTIFDTFAENIKIIIKTRNFDNILNPLTSEYEKKINNLIEMNSDMKYFYILLNANLKYVKWIMKYQTRIKTKSSIELLLNKTKYEKLSENIHSTLNAHSENYIENSDDDDFDDGENLNLNLELIDNTNVNYNNTNVNDHDDNFNNFNNSNNININSNYYTQLQLPTNNDNNYHINNDDINYNTINNEINNTNKNYNENINNQTKFVLTSNLNDNEYLKLKTNIKKNVFNRTKKIDKFTQRNKIKRNQVITEKRKNNYGGKRNRRSKKRNNKRNMKYKI